MNMSENMQIFMDAVERGRELHPGPYIWDEWADAFNGELDELEDECDQAIAMEKKPVRVREELMDVLVVGFRMLFEADIWGK